MNRRRFLAVLGGATAAHGFPTNSPCVVGQVSGYFRDRDEILRFVDCYLHIGYEPLEWRRYSLTITLADLAFTPEQRDQLLAGRWTSTWNNSLVSLGFGDWAWGQRPLNAAGQSVTLCRRDAFHGPRGRQYMNIPRESVQELAIDPDPATLAVRLATRGTREQDGMIQWEWDIRCHVRSYQDPWPLTRV